jgi:hypothetical protein
MSRFLAALKARVQEKRVPESPSKPSKGAFEGFEGDSSRGFFEIKSLGSGGTDEWASSLRRIDRNDPLSGFPTHWWVQIINDGLIFLEGWGVRAVALGWTESDMFGVHPMAPACRFDCMGLALLIAGGRVTALSEDIATLKSVGGSTLSHRRRPSSVKNPSLWHLQSLQKGDTNKEVRP